MSFQHQALHDSSNKAVMLDEIDLPMRMQACSSCVAMPCRRASGAVTMLLIYSLQAYNQHFANSILAFCAMHTLYSGGDASPVVQQHHPELSADHMTQYRG